ncbi:unnamed protein product [Prorocentrum cordatum]|uniref:Uncharacterized protein n=1 Tax=Prorocentrum cordatum TaxID=2364126 RepID=A0ABN9W710_9DINO|nr:unnamed protein product [Polarella glacialis]
MSGEGYLHIAWGSSPKAFWVARGLLGRRGRVGVAGRPSAQAPPAVRGGRRRVGTADPRRQSSRRHHGRAAGPEAQAREVVTASECCLLRYVSSAGHPARVVSLLLLLRVLLAPSSTSPSVLGPISLVLPLLFFLCHRPEPLWGPRCSRSFGLRPESFRLLARPRFLWGATQPAPDAMVIPLPPGIMPPNLEGPWPPELEGAAWKLKVCVLLALANVPLKLVIGIAVKSYFNLDISIIGMVFQVLLYQVPLVLCGVLMLKNDRTIAPIYQWLSQKMLPDYWRGLGDLGFLMPFVVFNGISLFMGLLNEQGLATFISEVFQAGTWSDPTAGSLMLASLLDLILGWVVQGCSTYIGWGAYKHRAAGAGTRQRLTDRRRVAGAEDRPRPGALARPAAASRRRQCRRSGGRVPAVRRPGADAGLEVMAAPQASKAA